MITWADVVEVVPGMITVPVGAQNLILSHVASVVTAGQWGSRATLGQTYLALHLGTIASPSGGAGQVVGPVVSETVGPVSRTFAVLAQASSDGNLGTTSWGAEYKSLRALLPDRFGITTLGTTTVL